MKIVKKKKWFFIIFQIASFKLIQDALKLDPNDVKIDTQKKLKNMTFRITFNSILD